MRWLIDQHNLLAMVWLCCKILKIHSHAVLQQTCSKYKIGLGMSLLACNNFIITQRIGCSYCSRWDYVAAVNCLARQLIDYCTNEFFKYIQDALSHTEWEHSFLWLSAATYQSYADLLLCTCIGCTVNMVQDMAIM